MHQFESVYHTANMQDILTVENKRHRRMGLFDRQIQGQLSTSHTLILTCCPLVPNDMSRRPEKEEAAQRVKGEEEVERPAKGIVIPLGLCHQIGGVVWKLKKKSEFLSQTSTLK